MKSLFITGHQGVVVVEGVELLIIVTISFVISATIGIIAIVPSGLHTR
jgi:hypothetical protein